MAAGDTKGDLISDAYTDLRISGLTSLPSAEDNKVAMRVLEDMASQFFEKDIDTGYIFEDSPDTGTPHGLKRAYRGAYVSNLALWLCAAFGKQTPQAIALQANKDYSFLSSATAKVRQSQYPSRMPIGSGNRLFSDTYFIPATEAPLKSSTKIMYINDINDFTESFNSDLTSGETIASFTISADTGLTIQSSSLSTPIVSYKILADNGDSDEDSGLLRVQIIVTTSTARVITRIINFELKSRI